MLCYWTTHQGLNQGPETLYGNLESRVECLPLAIPWGPGEQLSADQNIEPELTVFNIVTSHSIHPSIRTFVISYKSDIYLSAQVS